jgi:hypothetical protein
VSADDAGLVILAAFSRIVRRSDCGLLVFRPRSLAMPGR